MKTLFVALILSSSTFAGPSLLVQKLGLLSEENAIYTRLAVQFKENGCQSKANPETQLHLASLEVEQTGRTKSIKEKVRHMERAVRFSGKIVRDFIDFKPQGCQAPDTLAEMARADGLAVKTATINIYLIGN